MMQKALLVNSRAEKARVRILCDAAGVTAPAAREPLAQALLNLLLNALAHAPEGTAVELRARETAEAVELTVRDHGPGVPTAERERIWEPFQTSSDGTGLGLAVVRRLARGEGWAADVTDAPGGGAEFRLRIAHIGEHRRGRPAPTLASTTRLSLPRNNPGEGQPQPGADVDFGTDSEFVAG